MAAPIHRPVLCSFLYPPRSHLPISFPKPIRTFTNTSRQLAVVPKRGPAEQARSIQERNATRTSFKNATQQPDVGVLPDTLVMPTGRRLPSLFNNPRRRGQLEWLRLKRRFLDFFSLVVYKFGIVKTGPRPRIDFRRMKEEAKVLHHDMYTALAAGDESMLYKVCAKGLFNSFAAKVQQRPRGERYEWKAERYIGSPRVVSHRVAQLPQPFPEQSALRQAVVRIRSRQVLDKIQGHKRQEVSAKDMDEYLVLQKLMIEAKESDWVIWGTTHESDVDTLLKDEDGNVESA